MIVAAGLLVLTGLGLFVAGLLTQVTAFHWACVAACVVAAVVLYLARRRMPTAVPAAVPAGPRAAGRHAGAAPAEQVAPAATAASDATTTAVTTSAGAEPTGAARSSSPSHDRDAGEPPVEEVEVTDLLLVVDLTDEVLVVDEHPRYHVEGCRHLTGQENIPIPLDEARTDGFTPCGTCRPDATLAERVRDRT